MRKSKPPPKSLAQPPSKPTHSSEIEQLWPGGSRELLKALHILTRDGHLNQDSRRKLKQVKHLVQLITPHLQGMCSVADLGAGKSYLGFMLYDLWLRERDETRLWAIEQRRELIETCRQIASDAKFDRISFVEKSILPALESSEVPEQIDVVTALHACDTATDEAIAFAVRKQAKVIALVPCCQAEVAGLLESQSHADRVHADLRLLWRHGIHRREFGSHLTNVIRTLFLESHGYKVRVTELVGWEHSLKNELIIGERLQKTNPLAKRQLDHLLKLFPVPMRLFAMSILG